MRSWLIFLSLIVISSAGASEDARSLCLASIDRLNISASQAERNAFCRCMNDAAAAVPALDAELKANKGFPAPDDASDALKAAVHACRTA